MKPIDLTGKKLGRLYVKKENPVRSNSRQKRYDCICDCGNCVTVTGTALRNGTKSCGCIRIEMLKKRITKHKMTGHPIYSRWSSMVTRCYHPGCNRYARYGGRGIRMCKEWRDDFLSFHRWAIKNGWKQNLTIDRIDNNKGYSPCNCRFITLAENNRNMMHSRRWVIDNKTFNSLSLAGSYFGVSGSTIWRWCNGKKNGCYSIPLYGDINA